MKSARRLQCKICMVERKEIPTWKKPVEYTYFQNKILFKTRRCFGFKAKSFSRQDVFCCCLDIMAGSILLYLNDLYMSSPVVVCNPPRQSNPRQPQKPSPPSTTTRTIKTSYIVPLPLIALVVYITQPIQTPQKAFISPSATI